MRKRFIQRTKLKYTNTEKKWQKNRQSKKSSTTTNFEEMQ